MSEREIKLLRHALDWLLHETMFKDHPEASQNAIDVLKATTPPDVIERRRKGLPDYERPPLGQPPSWLQEQVKRDGT